MTLRRVSFPTRIIDKHVGGNTTYTQAIAAGLRARGYDIGRIPAGPNAPLTAAAETLFGLGGRTQGGILHYSADTGPLLRTRQPSIVTVHGVASRWITTARTTSQESIWRRRVSRAIRSTSGVITVSESSADDVSAVFGVDRAKITVIPHGIDRTRFATKASLSGTLKHLASRPYALYLGNIEPRKNLIALVEAFQTPEVKKLGVRLAIAGRPAWNAEASLEAIAKGGVDYFGFVSDKERAALMQHAVLFVFPSLYEGFGFPVLEAMAAGTPVLTSTRGSLAEIAGPALTIDDVTTEAIASGLVDALGSTEARERSVHAGLDWVKNFSWDESVERHIGAYKEVLGA